MKVTSTSPKGTTLQSGRVTKQQLAVDKSTKVDGPYAWYVLAVLVLMSVFNYIDRQIFAILAEEVKADLNLSDGDLGFLFGTAFAVFYAVFGIPLGRLADSWYRAKQISLSVGFWSIMTALSGLSKSFLPLAVCRFGVAVGEAGASPAALSLLYDYFSPKVRTTVMGIYAAGTSIGAGIGLFIGGVILSSWSNAWPDPSLAPFGLKGWQVAFMVVGLPGLVLALLLWTLKESPRGQAEGAAMTGAVSSAAIPVISPKVHPLRILLQEFSPMLPGINLLQLKREGAGLKAQGLHLSIGIGIALIATGLAHITGDTLQWLALGIGFYCAFSWAQVLLCRDPVCFGMIFKCKTVRYLFAFIGLNMFTVSALGFWTVPWLQREFGVSALQVGTVLGLGGAMFGLIGLILGGVLADRLRKHTKQGKLGVALVASILSLLAMVLLLLSENLNVVYGLIIGNGLVVGVIAAPVAATINDLMLPRSRAVAMALYIMVMHFLGISLGPYCVGLLSDSLTAAGTEAGHALRYSMQFSLIVACISILALILALKHIIADEDSILDRARALGEDI